MTLTQDEQLWVAVRLLSRAGKKGKDLNNLIRKDETPARLATAETIRREIAECQRVAAKLQGRL